jgi:oxygen-independent coproporphyrinogen-3 oxidase
MTTSSSPQPVASLYVHVPFCARKCAYCAFYSEPSRSDLVNRYIAALIREMELVACDLKLRTIFFGGGTPSLLDLRQWQRILRAMERLNLMGAAEWTVECNPATVSLDKARLLRSFGVNRISMGVQSLNDALLRRLGRIHTRTQVFKSFDTLRKAGFGNVNLDLMSAIPGQTIQIWRETLREATAMQSEHLSCYEVIYEEDTPMFEQLNAGEFDVDEDLACAMYDELVGCATTAGLQQYEIANFARGAKDISNLKLPIANLKPTARGATKKSEDWRLETGNAELPAFACRHNINYWRGGSFYGLGPSATSYVCGVRTKNWADTRIYCERLEQGERATESRDELSPLARAGETAAFGLRMTAGWPFGEFRRITGHDLRREWRDDMEQLVEQGWGWITPERFQLTRQGLRFADSAAELFLR